jgi:hypothetical protein
MSIVDLGPAAQRLADLVARIDDSELGKPTPCPAYALGDLIDHVDGLALAFTGAARKRMSAAARARPATRPGWVRTGGRGSRMTWERWRWRGGIRARGPG